jgi:uncharacterized protein YbjT (DUF2867 family)
VNSEPLRILVFGATGNVGRALVDRLAGEPVRLRAMARTPGTAGLPAGVEVVRGDLTDLDSVAAALSGVDRVFLLWPLGGGELTGSVVALADVDRAFLLWPLGGGDLTRTVVELIAARVRRIVYLSAIGVSEDGTPAPDPILQFHTDIEQAVRASGVEWTFVRSGGMASNTLGWADQIRESATVSWVHGEGGRALVHEADLAEVAALALLTDRLVGTSPEITGPTVLTQREQAAAIGTALGHPVTWHELPAADVRTHLVDTGWPPSAERQAFGITSLAEHT